MHLWRKLDKMINNSQNTISAYYVLDIFLYILYILPSNTKVVQWVSLGILDKIMNNSILETKKKLKVKMIRNLYVKMLNKK